MPLFRLIVGSTLLAGLSLAEVTHKSESKGLRVSNNHSHSSYAYSQHFFSNPLIFPLSFFRSHRKVSLSSVWPGKACKMTIWRPTSLRRSTKYPSKVSIRNHPSDCRPVPNSTSFYSMTQSQTIIATSRRRLSGLNMKRWSHVTLLRPAPILIKSRSASGARPTLCSSPRIRCTMMFS